MPQIGIDETMRILLVGEAPTIQQELEAALVNQIDQYKIDWIAQPELAVVRARDIAPHLILLDSALGDHDSVTLIRQLTSELGELPILTLIEGSNVEQARRTVLAGARGFVNKPLVSEDLIATFGQLLLPQVGAQEQTPQKLIARGRIVAFCSGKGGTGCSNLLVNSGLALRALTHQAVTLVDGNFTAPALPSLLNLLDLTHIGDLLEHLPRIEEALLNQVEALHVSGVRILLAPAPGSLSEPITPAQMQQILVQLKRNADWVLVDVGVPHDATAFAVLDAADRIVLSLLPEMSSLTRTQHLVERLRERRYAESKLWLTLNRATMRPAIGRNEIERRLRLHVQQSIPDDQPLLSHSINRGLPFISAFPKSAVSRSVYSLARRLAQDLQQAQQPMPSRESLRSNPLQRWLRNNQAIQV